MPRKVITFFRKLSTGMNRSILIRHGITENSIQMVSAPDVVCSNRLPVIRKQLPMFNFGCQGHFNVTVPLN